MNLQEEIKALKERIAELEEQVKGKQEFPQDGDEYWYIDDRGFVGGSLYTNHYIDSGRQTVDNFFSSREQAEFAAEKLKVEAELRKFSRPFECGAFNCCISLDTDEDCLYLDNSRYFHSQGALYFESKVKAQQAIEAVGEQRIKKYLFGVEG